MKLFSALQEKLLDVRLREKLIDEGKISKAEVDKFLAELPDDSVNMEEVLVENKEPVAPVAESVDSESSEF